MTSSPIVLLGCADERKVVLHSPGVMYPSYIDKRVGALLAAGGRRAAGMEPG